MQSNHSNVKIQPLLDEPDEIKTDERIAAPPNNIQNDKKNKWCCFYIKLPITGKLEKKTLTFIIITLTIDAISNLLLFLITNHWWFLHQHPITYFTWNDLYNDFTSFYSGTSDTILLWIIRTLLLFILSCFAISKGVPRELWNDKDPNICCCSWSSCCQRHKQYRNDEITNSNKVRRKRTSVSIQNFLSDHHNKDAMILSSNIKPKHSDEEEEYIFIDGIEDKSALQPKFDKKDDEESYRKRKASCIAYKYGTLFIMFVLCTVFQGYMGVKCVRFNFVNKVETFQAICYGLSIVCINIEIFLLKNFVESATDLGDRIVIKSIHPHPIKFMRKVNFWCDLCRGRTKSGSYRCDGCNFDLCRVCFKKEKKKLLKKQQEKQNSMEHGGKLKIHLHAASQSYQYKNAKYNPENDPTLQSQKELTSTQYVIRGIKLMKPHSLLIFTAFICLGITSVANLLLPRSQGLILDQIIGQNKAEFVYQVKYYLILSVIVGLFGSIRNLAFKFVSRRLIVSIRSLMFRNIIVQDIDFFDDMSTGELISRMTNDVSGMLIPLRTMLQSTLSNVILLFGGIVCIFITSWRLSMLAFTTIAPIILMTQQYAKWSKTINRSIWAAFASSTSIAQQAFSNIRTVRAFGTEKKETHNYDNALQEILERGLVNALATTVTFALTNYMDLLAGVMILWFGGVSILSTENDNKHNYELTAGKLIAFQLYWNMINNAWQSLQNVITQLTRSAGGAERVLSLLDNISKHNHNLYQGLQPNDGVLDGNIAINNVKFTYKSRPETQILNGINIKIKTGEVVAFVGKSGGGKTTLINLLMRFYDVDEGRIYYNASKLPLNEMNLTVLRHNIGTVAQDTQLFDQTIKENITYGICDRECNQISLDEVIYYAKLANCHEFIAAFEEGYDTRVGERGIKLSGGQKQRIAICRMLIKRPTILFLDEATSNLDTQSEALVQAAIDRTIWYKHKDDEEKYDNDDEKQYKFKCNAVILVAHRLSTVINADKIAVIDEGRVAEIGNHDELLQIQDGVYRRLVQRQIQREKNQLNEEEKIEEQDATKTNKKANVASDNIDSLFG